MSINDLSAQFAEIIKQNLPESVGQQLQDELTRLYELESTFEATRKSWAQLEQQLIELGAARRNLEAENTRLLAEAEGMKERERTVKEMELGLENAILKARIEAAELFNAKHLELVQSIFRSPIGKRMVNCSGGYNDAAGRWMPQTTTTTETFTEDPSP